MPDRAVLAYSGGLDTSIAIPWLREEHGLEVHCLAGDVGQGADELDGLADKALASGAASCRIADLRAEFVEHHVWPCLRALAVYEGRYLLGTSIARPILARAQVEYARELDARVLVHGCTGRGNDQVRFELAYQALAPDLAILAPWREWDIHSREDAIRYAEQHAVPVPVTRTKIYSRDRNLWHVSHEGGPLEDPATPPPDDVWTMTADPRTAPDEPESLRIGFAHGVPTTIDGRPRDGVALLEELNARGARHGIGRVDICENRLVGMKSRGVYETPGGTLAFEALRTLRSLTVERDTARQAERLALEYADVVYTGRWFHPLRRALDAFFTEASRPITGDVDLRLYKGTATAVAVSSPHSLFEEELATFGDGDLDHAPSRGFVRLYGLPGKVTARAHGAHGEKLGDDAEGPAS